MNMGGDAKKAESRSSRVIKRPETVPPKPPRLLDQVTDWQEIYANMSIVSSNSSADMELSPIYDEVGYGPPKEIPGPSNSSSSSPGQESPTDESTPDEHYEELQPGTVGADSSVHCPEDREIEIAPVCHADDKEEFKCQETPLEPEIHEAHPHPSSQIYELPNEISNPEHDSNERNEINGINSDDSTDIAQELEQDSLLTNEPSISNECVESGNTNHRGADEGDEEPNVLISPQLGVGRIRTVDGITTIEIDPSSIHHLAFPKKDQEQLRKRGKKKHSSSFEKSYRISQAMASEIRFTRKNPFATAKEKLRLKRTRTKKPSDKEVPHGSNNDENNDKMSRHKHSSASIITANVARVRRTVRRKMDSWYMRVKLPVESQFDKFQMNFFQEASSAPPSAPDSQDASQRSRNEMCHEEVQRKGQNDFEDLRRLVKQGGDFCKDLAAVLQERSELEAQYAKGLSKLSAKLLKASKEATGSVAHAWQAVAVQTDTQAELHRIWSTALSEEVSRPLRNSIETQHKIRKSVESLVEKTTRNLAEWRTAESKSKRQCFTSSKEFEKLQESGIGGNSNSSNHGTNFNGAHLNNNANSAIVSRSRLLSSVPPMDKDPIKLEAKRRKAEEAVRRADIEYYTFCVRSERARLEWEGAVRNGSTCLRTLEEEKLGLLKDLALKYFHYLSDLAPKLVLSTEALEEPVKSSSVDQDMHFLTDIRSHAGSEQLLPDFYAEDPSNLMKKERRKEALEKFVFLIRQDLDRERKGAAGVETLAKAIADSPKIDNAHHDISDRLYYMKSMLLYLEGSRTKLDNALADVDGRQRCSNAITQYMRHQRDKQGLPQTILKVPSWARDECLTSTVSSGVGSAGSSSPDWNDRGAADGNSHQHNDDFDEFSSEGSSENIEVFDEEPLPPATKGVSNLISVPSIGKCKAIYDYEANMFDELTIRTGDEINIHDKQDDGWWLGEANGVIGIFPATYVEELTQDEPPGE